MSLHGAPFGKPGSGAIGHGDAATLVSVNVGAIRTVRRGSDTLTTGIFKAPTAGSVAVGADGLDGDHVVDRRVHGGPRKTVYAYPAEHYPFWSTELALPQLPWGSFGENLTTQGLEEAAVFPGDVLVIGDVRLRVTQPRTPCLKLNARFGRDDLIERFLRARRCGFYLGVDQSGTVSAGASIALVPGPRTGPSILDEFDRRASRAR